MTPEKDVNEARSIRLDQDRVERAKARAAIALDVAAHHERAARAARAQAEQLARTWGFDLEPKEKR
jgi:hypothetical protein